MGDRGWKAVIFDMDGVVFNSESLFRRAWMLTFEELGSPFDDCLFREVIGCSASACRTVLVEKYGESFDCDSFVARKNSHFKDLRRSSLAYRIGFAELITEARSLGLRIALATSSSSAEVKANFDLLPRHAAAFDVVVTREHVQNPKPHQECYLRTSAQLGVAPSDCLVVEDSVVGTTAGLAAGCSVIIAPEPECGLSVVPQRVLAKVDRLADVIDFLI
jgi:HAD superfamily hydrolase (TIGR01509 family)